MIRKELVAASAEPLILSLLARGESYGYAIIQEVKARSDGKLQWTDGMLYPVLHRMEDRGLIKSRWGESETGRKRKYYSLKKDGKTAMAKHHEQWSLVHSVLAGFEKRSNMFDLEQAIADWRTQMLAAGIQTPVPLEELEIHLREEIERQMNSGLCQQQAFEISSPLMGEAALIKDEFKKIGTTRRSMMRTIAMLMSLFGTVLGGGMVLPAIGQWRDRAVLHLGPLLMGSTLAIIAGCAVIYGVRTNRMARGRKLISIFLIAAGSFYVVPLIQAFFIGKSDLAGWIFCAVLAAASTTFYGGCLYHIWHSPAPPTIESR